MPSASPLRAFGTPRVSRAFEGRTDTRKRRRLKAETRAMPKTPGVYFFYGYKGRLLYIGKAKCLRERVRSYFADTSLPRPAKIKRLLAEIERFEYREVGSELEALLLERRLIAEEQPLMNRQHKRFEVYPYLLLTDEAFPRLTITRAEPVAGETDHETKSILHEINEASRTHRPLEHVPRAGEVPGVYLGPFTTPRHAFWTLEAVRNLFPLRSCEGTIVPDEDGRGCFYREIGRCCGPCVGQTPQESYAELCADLVNLLKTGEAPQLEALRARMVRLADEWRFEEAGGVKQQLEAIELVANRLRRLTRMRGENNAVIVQPALPEDGESRIALFFVHGGLLRRHLTLERDGALWPQVRRELREIYGNRTAPADFTAKTELDEMMILDRWLRSNGTSPDVVWMNDLNSRQWVGTAERRLRVIASVFVES